MRDFLTTLVFLLPLPRGKARLLNLLGHRIHPTAWLGVNLVRRVGRFELAEGSAIGNFNVINNLDLVQLGFGARISYLNWVLSGYSPPPGEEPEGSELRTLRMGPHSRVISFHYLDCSGGLLIGEDCWITGLRTTVLTHAFDPHDGGIIVEPVELKKGVVLGTSCTLLPGTVIEEGALLAAGSTAWTRQELASGSLHGGVPARRLAPVKISDWVYNLNRYSR